MNEQFRINIILNKLEKKRKKKYLKTSTKTKRNKRPPPKKQNKQNKLTFWGLDERVSLLWVRCDIFSIILMMSPLKLHQVSVKFTEYSNTKKPKNLGFFSFIIGFSIYLHFLVFILFCPWLSIYLSIYQNLLISIHWILSMPLHIYLSIYLSIYLAS